MRNSQPKPTVAALTGPEPKTAAFLVAPLPGPAVLLREVSSMSCVKTHLT